MRVGIGALQPRRRRPVAGEHLRARQIERQEGLELLFRRQPTGVEEDRSRQVPRCPVGGIEALRVDAARPAQRPAEAARRQLLRERRRGDHDAVARVVEAPQVGVAERGRDGRARRDIFGKTRVIARRERQVVAQAIAARRMADRTFRGDVDMADGTAVALDPRQPFREAAHAGQREPDFGIGRQRHRPETGRPEQDDLDADGGGGFAQLLVRTNDAVDLRSRGVGRDEDAHQAAADAGRPMIGRSLCAGTGAAMPPGTCHRMISRRPSLCSAMAVQDSMKSPQFT